MMRNTDNKNPILPKYTINTDTDIPKNKQQATIASKYIINTFFTPFKPVGWVRQSRNPTFLLGLRLLTN